LEDGYKIYYTDHRLETDKKPVHVQAIAEDREAVPNDQQDVMAFKPQQRQQYRGPQQNFNNKGNS
jgi:hypothetical protein